MGRRLEERLRSGETAFGMWVTLRSADLTELIAVSGVDWICLDLEHTDLTYPDLTEHMRSARRSDMTVVVRIPDLQRDFVQRALDLGADGIMVPMVGSAEDVREAMRYAYYPPDGDRGVSPARANDWGGYTGLSDHLAEANKHVFVIPMIESRDAGENIEEIMAVPGLRVVFLGLADLSASHGDVGGFGGNEVVDGIVDRFVKAAADNDVATGVMALSPEDVDVKTADGYRLIGIGSDMGLFAGSLQERYSTMTGRQAER